MVSKTDNIKTLEEALRKQEAKVKLEQEKFDKLQNDFYRTIAEMQLKKANELKVSIADYLEMNG